MVRKRYGIKVDSPGLNNEIIRKLDQLGLKYKILGNLDIYIVEAEVNEINSIKSLYKIKDVCEERKINIEPLVENFKIRNEILAQNFDEEYNNWGLLKIKAPCLWARGLSGTGVKVGLLSSGVAPHNDLVIADNVSFVENESSMDYLGNGTGIAGIIGSRNLANRVGVAWNCELYNLKVIDSKRNGTLLSVIEAIDWAIENNLNIINISLSFDNLIEEEINMFQNAIDRADASGIIIIAGVGSDIRDGIDYPASLHPTMAIGATDIQDKIFQRANFGEGLDYVAPGVNIFTTYLNNSYKELTGTTIAAAMVTGFVALLLSDENIKNKEDVKAFLNSNIVDLGAAGEDFVFGIGRIQAPLNVTELQVVSSQEVFGCNDSGYISVMAIANEGIDKSEIGINIKITMPNAEVFRYSVLTDSAGVNRLEFGVICNKPRSSTNLNMEGTYIVEAMFVNKVCYPEDTYRTEFQVSKSMYKNWGISKVNIPCLWDRGLTGAGIKIGIIDSGIAPHRDLVIANNKTFIDGSQLTIDNFGQGTGIAGIIGSRGNKEKLGVAWESELYNLKVYNSDAVSPTTVDAVIRAIDWAIEEQLDILNIGVAYTNLSQDDVSSLKDAINRAYTSGIIIVATVGNGGRGTVSYPAIFEQVIAVGATDTNDMVLPTSNYGSGIDYVAPGKRIYTTTFNNAYREESGTSFATAFVTGFIALLLSGKTNNSRDEIIEILKSNAVDLGSKGYDVKYGRGRIQAPLNIIDLQIGSSQEVYRCKDNGYIGVVVVTEEGVNKEGMVINIKMKLPSGRVKRDKISTDVAGVARMDFKVDCSEDCGYDALAEIGTYVVEAGFESGPCYPVRLYSTQFEVSNSVITNWAPLKVKLPCLWEKGLSGEGIKVGVIDSGIASHKDLVIADSKTFVSGESDTEDINGHGTNIAGIIASRNRVDEVGIAWNCELYNLKVVDKDGNTNLESVISAINWAVENNLNILSLNISLGELTELQIQNLRDAINSANDKGIIMVAGTGNDGNGFLKYPAIIDNVIAVGATDKDDLIASFSNYGKGINYVAPGKDIYTTSLDGGYKNVSGTEFASAFLIGLIALLLGDRNIQGKDAVMEAINQNTIDLGIDGYDSKYGYGRIGAPLKIQSLQLFPSKISYSCNEDGYITAAVSVEDGTGKEGIGVIFKVTAPNEQVIESLVKTDLSGSAILSFKVDCTGTMSQTTFNQKGSYVVEAKFEDKACYPSKIYRTAFEVDERQIGF